MALEIIPATMAVLAAGVLVAYRLPVQGAVEGLSAAMLLALAALSGELLVAGVLLDTLDPSVVLALAVGIFALAAIAVGAHRASARSRLLTKMGVDLRRVAGFLRREPLVAVLAIVVVGALLWRAVLAVRLPIIDFDGLAYHVVTVDVWLQADHIGRVPQRIWSDGYPANGELVTLWLMLFAKSDLLAPLTGLVALPLAAAATAGFAREMGASRRPAAICALVVVATPAVMLKADSTYIDNIGMAYLASAWFFGLRALRTTEPNRRLAMLFLAGLAIGLAAGTKSSLLVPLVGVGLAAVVQIGRRIRGSVRSAAVESLALGGPVIAFGASWYLKDLIVFGNPFWPISVGPFTGAGSADSLITGTPERIAGMARIAQLAVSWTADLFIRAYPEDTRLGGFGLAWLPLVALSVLAAVWLIRRRRWTALIVIGIPVALTVALMPDPWWPRYTLFVAVLAAGLAALMLSRLPPIAGRAATVAVTALAVISLLIVHRTANFRIGEDGPALSGARSLVKLVLADDATRRHVVLWDACRGFEQIPSGARVRTDGFQLPHLIVGHQVDRVLLVPFGPGTSPGSAVAFDGVRADYLVLTDPAHIAAASSDPEAFVPLGSICRGASLFQVR